MQKPIWLVLSLALAATVQAGAYEGTMKEATALREKGEFNKATEVLQGCLKEAGLSSEERSRLGFEIERMARIRLDYTLSPDDLYKRLQGRISDFSREEFDKLDREGKLDSMTIDGKKLYVKTTPSNIFLRLPELKARQKNATPDGTLRKLYNHMLEVKKAQASSGDGLLCPQDFKVTYKLSVNPDAVPDGKTVRCWLPYLHTYNFQTSASILQTEPKKYEIAPADADHRTIYMEKVAKKGQPTEFSETFVYRCYARARKLDPAAVRPYNPDSPEVATYAAEKKPHIDFSDATLKELNAKIVGDEKNPLVIAKKIHDWIANNMIYQYAREYSTLDNISHYCASRRAGDCGQHGMTFIALCRMNGIPARWQTGWESFEARNNNNMHDWSEIYVEPYGWLPVDADMAVLAMKTDELNPSERKELADWLFGNQDHFRFAVNSDFSAPLFPEKNDFRSETVDFQRGEVEYGDHNLYFDKWSYDMTIEPISAEEMQKLQK